MVEAADRAGVAPEQLPGLRQRIAAQAGRLTQAATQAGGPLPALVPTPAEVAIAAQAFGDLSAEAVARAVRTIDTTLTAVDATLEGRTPGSDVSLLVGAAGSGGTPGIPSQPSPSTPAGTTPGAPADPTTPSDSARQPGHRVGLRNAAVYAAYAVPVLAVQAFLFLLLDEAASLPMASPLCLLVLPALAFLAGYLTIGTLFPAPPGEKVNRSPRLGIVICLIPDVLLCAGFVAFEVLRFFG
jgi:Uncharacterized protein contain chitin-binding domain type 3